MRAVTRCSPGTPGPARSPGCSHLGSRSACSPRRVAPRRPRDPRPARRAALGRRPPARCLRPAVPIRRSARFDAWPRGRRHSSGVGAHTFHRLDEQRTRVTDGSTPRFPNRRCVHARYRHRQLADDLAGPAGHTNSRRPGTIAITGAVGPDRIRARSVPEHRRLPGDPPRATPGEDRRERRWDPRTRPGPVRRRGRRRSSGRRSIAGRFTDAHKTAIRDQPARADPPPGRLAATRQAPTCSCAHPRSGSTATTAATNS